MKLFIATYKTPDGWTITRRIEAEDAEFAWQDACSKLDDLLYDFNSNFVTVRPARKQEEQ